MIKTIKRIARRMPGGVGVYLFLKRVPSYLYARCVSTERIFGDIYRRNAFGGKDSVSGAGSDLQQTKVIREKLPTLLRDLGVSTLLDIPCGDFYWMKMVSLGGISYIGADIVKEIIEKNRVYDKENVHFQQLNLLRDELPTVDMVLCRDCLVHFSLEDVFLALRNICSSQSTYLLTTTFTSRTRNDDILTGQWRTLNLQEAPFNLPKPLCVINEGCTEAGGAFSDKALGLWRVDDLHNCLAMNRKP